MSSLAEILIIRGLMPIESLDNASVLIYSPCQVAFGSSSQLQIYAGGATVGRSAHIGFVPVGIPGFNLSTGSSDSIPADPGKPATTYAPRTLASFRNV